MNRAIAVSALIMEASCFVSKWFFAASKYR